MGRTTNSRKGVDMQLGEVKLEALRLMFINMDKSLDIQDLQDLYDDKIYGLYLNNMTGSINRAIDRINTVRVLPLKSVNVQVKADSNNTKYIDLSEITDYYDVFNLYEVSSLRAVPFMVLDDNKIIPQVDGESFVLAYQKKYSRISDTMADTAVLDIKDEVASIIPYFIKSDLYQEDNAVLASEARNIFEQSLEELKREYYVGKTIKRNYRV